MTIIIHVACAGVEHIGKVEGNSWKKALKRQMLVLYDAVKVIYSQDQQGNIAMTLTDMKKRRQGANSIETKYEGTVYVQLSTQYPYYIWPVKTDGDLYRVYKNALSEIILPPDKKIVEPTSMFPIHPQQNKGPHRKH